MFSTYHNLTTDQIIEKELERNNFTRNDFTQEELHFLGKEIEVWRIADNNLEGKLGELEVITFHKMFLKIILERAKAIATSAHEGQVDKAGKPYIEHPTRVMNMGKTVEEKIAGVLHDVVEDSEWTFEMLEKEGIPKDVMDALRCVTKLSEDEDYDHFIERVKTNPLAVKVKINDLKDNMDITRLGEVTEKDLGRLNKYIRAYRQLTE
jgi:(p)ppGpp synthase/HD superfamily hydrolase